MFLLILYRIGLDDSQALMFGIRNIFHTRIPASATGTASVTLKISGASVSVGLFAFDVNG